uniref:Enoyl-CoA hydratase domain-containing protein 3, mitochondrial n=1 Tax=Candidatus Kentrum sp. DK TaxID=2126562 RepID=A0A450T7H3_9GAMM|nr:MAG: short chain enoyl-CoA hydratase [Candidatus Kentron sp. DK]
MTRLSFPDDRGLLYHAERGVATLTLNRPAQYNALSKALLIALQATLDDIAVDRSIRVVVLAGNGPAFCAGHDLKEMRAGTDGNYHHREYYEDLFRLSGQVMARMARLPQPVVARVHGLATAAGCQLVAACDLAVAAETARFAVSGINLGLFCSGPAVPLSRSIPRKVAFEMLVTGEFIDARTAKSHGLINRVAPREELDRVTDDLAGSILKKSPAAVAMGKRMFYRQLERNLEDAYEYAAHVMAANMMTEDAMKGIDEFLG